MMRIYNASATLPTEALAAFARIPDRVVLHPGEQLFRLGSVVGPGVKGNEIFSSPWWIPAATYQQITKTAHRTGRSVTEVARSRLAVTADWNPNLDWLSILELKVAVYAWIGPARQQPLTGGDRSVLLLGHFDQHTFPTWLRPAHWPARPGSSSTTGVLSSRSPDGIWSPPGFQPLAPPPHCGVPFRFRTSASTPLASARPRPSPA